VAWWTREAEARRRNGPYLLPLEKRAGLATVLVAIAFACQQTISGSLYAFNRYALSFGCGESPAMFPSGTVRTLEEYSLDGPIFNSIAAGGYLLITPFSTT